MEHSKHVCTVYSYCSPTQKTQRGSIYMQTLCEAQQFDTRKEKKIVIFIYIAL